MNPQSITYHAASRTLELCYADGVDSLLPAELLRVYSPSAEVRGHSESERKLQTGKKHIAIDSMESIGNYALRIVFSDGHDTGIYSWETLYELGSNFDTYWQDYLSRLSQAGLSRRLANGGIKVTVTEPTPSKN